jgi:hypothetical protein
MNMATKVGVFDEKAQEYYRSTKQEKGLILDAVVRVTGLTRKGAIKRFGRMQTHHPLDTDRRGRPVYYGKDVTAALHEVWVIGSSVCGENLHPQIGEFIDNEVRHGRWSYRDDTTAKLRAMSAATVRRHVHGFRMAEGVVRGKSTTRPSTVMSLIPIRMDGWDTAETGVVQIDTVAHCGDSVAGDFVYTVNGTDVATLWGSRRAQWQKGQYATVISLDAMCADTPFPWTEAHPDSGSEFVNAHCVAYATARELRLTRSRPYHKNDNCFVEERNGHIVRTYVGYTRFDAPEVVDVLNDLYDVLTPYLNHFVASKRIVSKVRVGSKWKVTREKQALTPYHRVLLRTDVSDAVKTTLRVLHATLDPKTMRENIDRLTKRVQNTQRQYGIPR